MRILVALDSQTYSEYALKQSAKLAANTWADVTLLTVNAQVTSDAGKPTSTASEALRRYKELFLQSSPQDESPYAETRLDYEMMEIKRGTYELMQICRPARKELKLRMRTGNPAEEILKEAREEGHDLLVLGCPRGEKCIWKGSKRVPAKVVNESTCSVFVIKEDRPIRTILCALDQDGVSQESMEIINQMAIIHEARLNLIGLTREQGIRVDVDRELWRILDYYRSHEIDADVRLKEVSALESFLESEAMPDLVALWMSKKSLIKRFLPKDWAGGIVQNSPCSVLILR